jgi:AraC-like DNA-binding protein
VVPVQGTLATMVTPRRDRLRELLDAVLDGTADGRAASLDAMADQAGSSPFHFSRLLSHATGEAPVTMRRRVMLERAAWQLARGASVTDAAFDAGYESVEGFARAFARAFGHPPSVPTTRHQLPAPNGIHFHPPAALWIDTSVPIAHPVLDHLIVHDLDDTRHLIDLAATLTDDQYRAARLAGARVLSWHGLEQSIADVLENHVWTKEVWVAAIEGSDVPVRDERASAADLLLRHDAVASRWEAIVRDIGRRDAWGDTLVDALCDPPQSFVLGHVVTHVVTYAAGRRMLARVLLRTAGVDVDDGDPIEWARARNTGGGRHDGGMG